MVALPRRRRADGTVICFWQLCLKCAKEVLHGREKNSVRNLPEVRVSKDAPRGQTKESNVLRRMQSVVRNVKQEDTHGKGSKKVITKSDKNKRVCKPSRKSVRLPGKCREKRSHQLRNDGNPKNLRCKKTKSDLNSLLYEYFIESEYEESKDGKRYKRYWAVPRGMTLSEFLYETKRTRKATRQSTGGGRR